MSEAKLVLPSGTKVPDHIALVLDGNRRWARSRGLKPWEGHRAGFNAVKKLAKATRDMGTHTFTIWAFSTENWDRSKEEIEKIFELFKKSLIEFEKEAHREKVRLIHLGRKDRLPKDFVALLNKVEQNTKVYSSNILNLALDYGGKDEIVRATQKIIREKISADKINEKLFESYLDTTGQPYPYVDLFIRTSGEQRTSGLLPWQMAYAEYYFETDHLPDFTPEKLRNAILDYSRRRRRFGGNDAEEHLSFNPEVVAKLELAWWRLKNIPEGERFRDYALRHVKAQYGLSKELARDAAKYMIEGLVEGRAKDWEKAGIKLRKFYRLIKNELKLAFEPRIVASLEVKFNKETEGKGSVEIAADAEKTARELYAEVYRISLLQAAKAAHLRVMAAVERNLAEAGYGEAHWAKAEEYLTRFYRALKERVA